MVYRRIHRQISNRGEWMLAQGIKPQERSECKYDLYSGKSRERAVYFPGLSIALGRMDIYRICLRYE